jgi:hypothetical protein
MKKFTGRNPDYVVEWDCSRQSYTVFYRQRPLGIVRYKYSDIQSYLN